MTEMPDTEWATDYWGEILSEPTERHARKVASANDVNLYSRSPMGSWNQVDQ